MRLARAARAAATCALCCCCWTVAAREPERVPLYSGAAYLFNLDRITVVYPAGPGEDVETNRISAERRASYLRQVHDIDARAAADDSLSDEQLDGHLLLTGWGNRLLQVGDTPSPVRRHGNGWRLLDEIEIGPGEDLIFIHASPYNSERMLVFWSRIDLELDRFLALPFVGSDWAVFRVYRDVRNGRFSGGTSWPPRRNPLAESTARRAPRPAAARRSSAHYDLRFHGALLAEDEAEKVLAAREAAWERIVEQLGSPAEEFRIQLFVYASEEEMDEQTGVHEPFFCVPGRRELHMTRRFALSANPHEDTHLVARQQLGPSYVSAMIEGLAVTVGTEPRDLALYAAALLERNTLPTIAELLDEERMRVLAGQRTGLPAAGLLVDFVRQNADATTLRRAYSLKSGEPVALAALLGRSLAELEREFRSWASERAASAQTDLAFQKAIGEAKRRRDAGDHAGDAAALERALELRPGDVETLYKLALARIRGGRYTEAERTLGKLLERTADDPASRYGVFGQYQLGQVLDRLGRRDEARERYERVLELPDRHGSHRMAREALEDTRE